MNTRRGRRANKQPSFHPGTACFAAAVAREEGRRENRRAGWRRKKEITFRDSLKPGPLMTTEQQKKRVGEERIPSIYPGGRAAMLLQCRRRRRKRKRVESHLILLLSQIRFGGRRRRWGGGRMTWRYRRHSQSADGKKGVYLRDDTQTNSLLSRTSVVRAPPGGLKSASSPSRSLERDGDGMGYEALQAKARPQIGSYFFCSPPPIFFSPYYIPQRKEILILPPSPPLVQFVP